MASQYWPTNDVKSDKPEATEPIKYLTVSMTTGRWGWMLNVAAGFSTSVTCYAQ